MVYKCLDEGVERAGKVVPKMKSLRVGIAVGRRSVLWHWARMEAVCNFV